MTTVGLQLATTRFGKTARFSMNIASTATPFATLMPWSLTILQAIYTQVVPSLPLAYMPVFGKTTPFYGNMRAGRRSATSALMVTTSMRRASCMEPSPSMAWYGKTTPSFSKSRGATSLKSQHTTGACIGQVPQPPTTLHTFGKTARCCIPIPAPILRL